MDEDSLFKTRLMLESRALKRLSKAYFSLNSENLQSMTDYLLELDNTRLHIGRFYRIQAALERELSQICVQSSELDRQKRAVQEDTRQEKQMIEREKHNIELKKELDSIVTDIQRLPSPTTLQGHCKNLEKEIHDLQTNIDNINTEHCAILQGQLEPQLYQFKTFHETFFGTDVISDSSAGLARIHGTSSTENM